MKNKKIYVAGHKGMVGSAVLDVLSGSGYSNIIIRSRKELDLRKQADVEKFMGLEKPDVIILAAAKVGGILANHQYPYNFLYDNLAIQSNVIQAAHKQNVNRLIFLGSSCIYPKYASQPIREDYLLTGALEPTNQWYAIAKIAGLKLCQSLKRQHSRNYITLMPTNLYGPGDNFDTETAHVVAAMIRKFHEAKKQGCSSVTLWGTGNPKRELLYVEDLANAILFAFENNLQADIYNIGCGRDISIQKLADLIRKITGYAGSIRWDTDKPDGTPRKLLDISKINAEGWHHTTNLQAGLEKTYRWYVVHEKELASTGEMRAI